jgi:hypothetical protein
MRGPTWCRRRADEIGAATTAVIADLLRDNALFRLRAAQGVLGLADRHGADRLERACAKAIAVDDPTYRTIKGILAVRREADPPPPSTGDGGAAAFLQWSFATVWQRRGPAQPDGTATASTDTDTAPAGGDRDGSGHDEPGRGVSA